MVSINQAKISKYLFFYFFIFYFFLPLKGSNNQKIDNIIPQPIEINIDIDIDEIRALKAKFNDKNNDKNNAKYIDQGYKALSTQEQVNINDTVFLHEQGYNKQLKKNIANVDKLFLGGVLLASTLSSFYPITMTHKTNNKNFFDKFFWVGGITASCAIGAAFLVQRLSPRTCKKAAKDNVENFFKDNQKDLGESLRNMALINAAASLQKHSERFVEEKLSNYNYLDTFNETGIYTNPNWLDVLNNFQINVIIEHKK